VLEETGLITSLGHWVLDAACGTAESWRRRWPQLTINVNLQARELAQSDLVRLVERALATHALPPQALNLELTESVVMDETAEADRILADLKRLGVGLVIDDFGIGYSSLSYLHRLPIDTVKVDRSFIAHLDDEGGDEELLRSIAALARALSLRVVAEGVEQPHHLAALRRLGYDAAQGFYFARPLDRTGLEEVLAEGQSW
jgi:EAL domain-containing protein (putative c-di-GMP-specific phosphodiesterase class I)